MPPCQFLAARRCARTAALQASGFQPNVEQSRTAELTLRGLFAGAPLLGAILAIAVLRRFTLDHELHARIRSQLEARR